MVMMGVHQKLAKRMFIVPMFIIEKNWKQLECSITGYLKIKYAAI